MVRVIRGQTTGLGLALEIKTVGLGLGLGFGLGLGLESDCPASLRTKPLNPPQSRLLVLFAVISDRVDGIGSFVVVLGCGHV
eukprot:349541-Amorphochlora_amoeboformis.AAC.1